jgi:hypothetical protein
MINSSNTVQLDQHVGGGESLTAAVAVALESNDCSRRGSKQTPRLTSLSGQLERLSTLSLLSGAARSCAVTLKPASAKPRLVPPMPQKPSTIVAFSAAAHDRHKMLIASNQKHNSTQ